MDTHGLAALLEIINDLRSTIEREPPSWRREDRVAHAARIEGYWSDLTQLLDEERQTEVARLDRWLAQIEQDLASGGDTAKLIALGLRVADRRSRVLKLDARTVIQPRPSFITEAIGDAEIENERASKEIEEGRGGSWP